jgi:collagenase-like PrtC family protease
MERVELLLPAGSPDALRAAVTNGADAVYLGLSRFSARQFADNFTRYNIADAIQYCHERQVKVYITLNTLIKNHELQAFFEQASIAYQAKADALIIQDAHLAPILKKNFPGIEIHLSTQATVTNRYAIPETVDRVILARELTLSEVTAIAHDHTVEVFLHGALCVAYSGQCLFSSMVGGRSGNRGMCAQPCRKPYNERYALSTKDLCQLPNIPALIESGVHSLKIEGRMKGPLYVGTVARIYRKAIDSYYEGEFAYSDDDIRDLKQVFNRNFTQGHLFSDTIIDSRKQSNRGLYIGTLTDDTVTLVHDIHVDDVIKVDDTTKTIRTLKKGKEPVKQATAGETVKINMLTCTRPTDIYRVTDATLTTDLGDPIPQHNGVCVPSPVQVPDITKQTFNNEPLLCVALKTKEHAILADENGADIIYYPLEKDDFSVLKKECKKARVFADTKRVLRESELEPIRELLLDNTPDGVLIHDRGLLAYLQKYPIPKLCMHLSYEANVFNDLDVNSYAKQEIVPIISPELSFKQLQNFSDKRFMVYVYGRLPLMTIKSKIKGQALTDEENREFPLEHTDSYTLLYNERPLGITGTDLKRLLTNEITYFYCELEDDVPALVTYYKKMLTDEPVRFPLKRKLTKGHFETDVL